ncbi:hypothetical protein GGF31_008563 [Allomyces arbusculus]|nr:hypothetical protein GGF31_008563 [Allomyces arbusculus]
MSMILRQAAAVKSLSKPTQRARDNALVLAVDTPWEDYLSPAPMCISILGQLQLVATKSDFNIKNSAPLGGFKHVKYPDSFRACLVQVTNSGWRAFNMAHTNMNQIKLLSNGMPDQIESMYKILVLGSTTEIEEILPEVLDSVSRDAEKCEVLAKAVDREFMEVMDLASELLEVCTNQMGLSQQELEQVRATLAAKESLSKSIAKAERDQADRVKELKDASKDAEETFSKTLANMPSGWDCLAMNLVESLGKTVTNVADRMLNMGLPANINFHAAGGGNNAGSNGSVGFNGGGQIGGKHDKPSVPAAIDKALDVSEELLSMIKCLCSLDPKTGLVEGAKDDKQGLDANKPDNAKLVIGLLGNSIEKLSAMVSESGTAKDQLDIAKKAAALAKHVDEVARSFNKSDDVVQKIKSDAEHLYLRQQNRAAAEASQKRYDEQVKEMRRIQMHQAEVLAEMAKINVQEINFSDIITVLKKGIKALADLRTQWQSLCRFFSNLTAIVETCNSNIKNLTKTTSKYAQIRMSDGSSLSALGRDLIYDLCVKSDAVSRVVRMIAETYVDISTQHLMTPLVKLGDIAALDAATDAPEISRLQRELITNMAESQKSIVEKITAKKNQFKIEIKDRAAQVEKALGSVLPPPPKEIKAHVQQAQQIVDTDRKAIEDKKTEDLAAAGLLNDFF